LNVAECLWLLKTWSEVNQGGQVPRSEECRQFEFASIPSLNKTLVLELARSEYVARRENIIAVGNSGTGRPMLR
jgi:IstB-like ATP binding protein